MITDSISDGQKVYRYEISPADTLVSVDQWWLAFAKENNAATLDSEAVLGRQIWDFISDQPTRDIYREIHARVRKQGKAIVVPFRCDSPTLQRFMELKISKGDNESLIYESRLVHARVQARLPVLGQGNSDQGSSPRSEHVLTMCSFCKRSLIKPFSWVDLEDISLQLRMFDDQVIPELRYTVCPSCSERFSTD